MRVLFYCVELLFGVIRVKFIRKKGGIQDILAQPKGGNFSFPANSI